MSQNSYFEYSNLSGPAPQPPSFIPSSELDPDESFEFSEVKKPAQIIKPTTDKFTWEKQNTNSALLNNCPTHFQPLL
jgi:hypothetical protein